MTGAEDYVGRVQAIVWRATAYLSAQGINRVQHLIDHGEPAEGMHSLAWIIVNERVKVPTALIQDIREHASGLVPDESMPDALDTFGSDELLG